MLQLSLSQGISSGCHHATPKPFFVIVISVRKGHYASASTYPGYFSGCHHATVHPFFLFFRNFHLCGEGALCFCFELARVYLQGATMPSLHQKFYSELSVVWERRILLLLRLGQGFSSGCTMQPLYQKQFLVLSLLWEGALCFGFGLAKVYFRVHHDNPTPNFLFFFAGRGLYASASTQPIYFFRVPP